MTFWISSILMGVAFAALFAHARFVLRRHRSRRRLYYRLDTMKLQHVRERLMALGLTVVPHMFLGLIRSRANAYHGNPPDGILAIPEQELTRRAKAMEKG